MTSLARNKKTWRPRENIRMLYVYVLSENWISLVQNPMEVYSDELNKRE